MSGRYLSTVFVATFFKAASSNSIAILAAPLAVGTIRLDVPKLAELETSVKSPTYSIGNLSCLAVNKVCLEDDKNLAVAIYCNEENKSPYWRCEAVVTFHLLAQKSGQQTYSQTLVNRKFDVKKCNRGFSPFMKWEDVLKLDEGFIRESDGGVAIEAVVTVTKVVGESMSTLNHFAAMQSGNFTNVTLIVEEKELFVNKQYLAMYSPVFRAMFFTDFAERDEKVVPLPDVKHDEFVLFLNVFHPARMPVTADTVEFLLRLADRFHVQVVLCECENLLCGTESGEIPLETKLLLADRFRLGRLLSVCLNSLKSSDDVRLLKAKKEFCDLTDKTKAALGDRILELTMT